jgi:hypothetical protein
LSEQPEAAEVLLREVALEDTRRQWWRLFQDPESWKQGSATRRAMLAARFRYQDALLALAAALNALEAPTVAAAATASALPVRRPDHYTGEGRRQIDEASLRLRATSRVLVARARLVRSCTGG